MQIDFKNTLSQDISVSEQTFQAINQIVHQLSQHEIQLIGQDLLKALKISISDWPQIISNLNPSSLKDEQIPTTDPYLHTAEILIKIHALANKSNFDDLTHKVQPQILKCLSLYQQPFDRTNEAE